MVQIEKLKLQNKEMKRKNAAREKLKNSLKEKPFIDFRQVRIELPEKPAAGYSLVQLDQIEKDIVKVLVNKKQLKIPTCRLDNYLGILTVTHPELFDEEFHGYVSLFGIQILANQTVL